MNEGKKRTLFGKRQINLISQAINRGILKHVSLVPLHSRYSTTVQHCYAYIIYIYIHISVHFLLNCICFIFLPINSTVFYWNDCSYNIFAKYLWYDFRHSFGRFWKLCLQPSIYAPRRRFYFDNFTVTANTPKMRNMVLCSKFVLIFLLQFFFSFFLYFVDTKAPRRNSIFGSAIIIKILCWKKLAQYHRSLAPSLTFWLQFKPIFNWFFVCFFFFFVLDVDLRFFTREYMNCT